MRIIVAIIAFLIGLAVVSCIRGDDSSVHSIDASQSEPEVEYQTGDKVLLKMGVEATVSTSYWGSVYVYVVLYNEQGQPIEIEKLEIPRGMIERKIE